MATMTHRGPRHRYRQPKAPLPDWVASGPIYRPRRPTTTPLYPVVQHHLETFLAQATQTDPMGFGPPAWVERNLQAYLKCGILAHGFARARCEDCGHERLIPFSCKTAFLHRFGAALNTHFHYHIVVLDGVFAPAEDREAHFHAANQLTPAHWLELQHVIQHRVLRYFRNQGLLDDRATPISRRSRAQRYDLPDLPDPTPPELAEDPVVVMDQES